VAYNRLATWSTPGLKEFVAYLRALGVADDIIKTANQLSAEPLRVEIVNTSPRGITGRLAGSVKVNKALTEIRVTAGNNTTVKYALNYHAIKLGRSGGYFSAKVPAAGTRAEYVRRWKLQDRPYVYTAAIKMHQAFLDNYVKTLDAVARSHPSGSGVA
jgi:hypothetical protein